MGTATNSSPAMALEKGLGLKRIGWLYPIFRGTFGRKAQTTIDKGKQIR